VSEKASAFVLKIKALWAFMRTTEALAFFNENVNALKEEAKGDELATARILFGEMYLARRF
jgi:hypothetical protein